ncbi:MAG: glycosyltransferase family 39 protein [Gordonia sp. (in: high G+C Gram-positive bacteria)]
MERAGPPTVTGLPRFAAGRVTAVAGAVAVVLTALSGRYGFHRDELYFMVAGRHLAWGYVDQPPLTPALARLSTAVFGDSPAGLRVVATLAFAAAVVVVALIAREFGADPPAQVLAAVGTAGSGYPLAVGHLVSTSGFDLLAWVVIGWTTVRLLRTGDHRWWPAVGLGVGVGLLNKYLVVLLVAVLLAAMVVTGPGRTALRSWWPVAGAGIALAVAAPTLWWQASHGWPQVTVACGISADDGTANRILVLPGQVLFLSPLLVPVWITGWLRCGRDPAIPWARPLAVAYPLLCVLVIALGGKAYYSIPLLLVLLAAGCAPAWAWCLRGPGVGRRWLAGAVPALAALASAVISLPVLPASELSVPNAINREQGEQVGWPALVDAVAAAWRTIPPADRSRAVILTDNYGQAGAIARYGPARGLPDPYSGHMSFADWGRPPDSATGPVILVGDDEARLITGCRGRGRVDNGYGLDNEEQGTVVSLCAGPIAPWSRIWASLRYYY